MTCEYAIRDGACIPLRVHTVVVSVQHSPDVAIDRVRSDLLQYVIKAVIPDRYLDDETIYHLNPCGQFVIGGPQVRITLCQAAFVFFYISSGLLFEFKCIDLLVYFSPT